MGTVPRVCAGYDEMVGDAATVNTVVVSAAANGTRELLAAPGAGKQIWIMMGHFSGSANGTVTFKDGDGNALSGAMPVVANQVLDWEMTSNINYPHMIVPTNKALNVTLSASTALSGMMTYAVVTVPV